ncbi:MAG: hypothetical protein RLZ12_471 [Bacillota bacterium]
MYLLVDWWEQRNITAPSDASNAASLAVIPVDAKVVKWQERPTYGQYFANLRAPKIDLAIPVRSLPIKHDKTKEDAIHRIGAGHNSSGALPGETGNCYISAHNDTQVKGFMNLGSLVTGDKISIECKRYTFIYEVEWHKVVDKAEGHWQTERLSRPILRLQTCYPLGYSFRTSQRYIVQCKLIGRYNNGKK